MNKQQLPYYLAAGILFLLLKLAHSLLEVDSLHFLLYPTDKLLALMTGTSSDYLPGSGYFNKNLNILINKSCSGFNFWLICFLMLYTIHLKFVNNTINKVLLLPASLLIAYFLTIFVNSARILIAVKIQASEWIPKQPWLHQAEGVFVYLFFLIIIYLIANYLLKKYSPTHEKPA